MKLLHTKKQIKNLWALKLLVKKLDEQFIGPLLPAGFIYYNQVLPIKRNILNCLDIVKKELGKYDKFVGTKAMMPPENWWGHKIGDSYFPCEIVDIKGFDQEDVIVGIAYGEDHSRYTSYKLSKLKDKNNG